MVSRSPRPSSFSVTSVWGQARPTERYPRTGGGQTGDEAGHEVEDGQPGAVLAHEQHRVDHEGRPCRVPATDADGGERPHVAGWLPSLYDQHDQQAEREGTGEQ
jgi:hypothetical protein